MVVHIDVLVPLDCTVMEGGHAICGSTVTRNMSRNLAHSLLKMTEWMDGVPKGKACPEASKTIWSQS